MLFTPFCILIAAFAMRKQALICFLAGDILGANMIMYDKEKFKVVPQGHGAALFSQQDGDWLNMFRPRG
jgi:hypothetical protein